MPTTAREIIQASLVDLNVLGEGTAMTAEMGQDGLRRLNRLVSGFQAQPGTVVAIERQVFPLVSGKAMYTIGLGGDFDVPRPIGNLPGAGLLMQGLDSAVSITSITRSAYAATVTQTGHGYSVGDWVLVQGATETPYNGLQQVQSVPTADTWTYTLFGLPTTPATGTLTARLQTDQPVEIPRPVITVPGWQSIQIKNLPNQLFTTVYYVPTYPFGQVVLWPLPDTAENQLVLYLSNVFSQFASLDAAYDWPSLPGYAEAVQYQLTLRLAPPYGRPVSEALRTLARETLGIVKRANTQLVDLPTDATAVTSNVRGGYNINTDTQGL